MAKLIEEHIPHEPFPKRKQCQRCLSIFEVNESDLFMSECLDGYYVPAADCPKCGQANTIDFEDELAEELFRASKRNGCAKLLGLF